MLLRLVFSGRPGHAYATMLGSFIYLSPLVVGAVTVYVAERTERRSWGYYVKAAFVANVAYVVGTLVIMIEGLICAIVIVPLFAVLGSIGRLAMGAACRLTHWPRRTTLQGLWALPLLLGGVEAKIDAPIRERAVECSQYIAASPERVWHEIHHADSIRPDEMNAAWLFRIGVPLPKAGISQDTPEGKVRRITMGKDVHFEQVVTEREENRKVRWTHRYAEDSFPRYALDDHVVLGGHYFDVNTTSYELTPRGDGTELRVRMTYRVSTSFNWYADPIARMLLDNFESVLLRYYARRSGSVP